MGAPGDEVVAAAVLNRLLHHCHIVNIRRNSDRTRLRADLAQALHQAPTTTQPSADRFEAAASRRLRLSRIGSGRGDAGYLRGARRVGGNQVRRVFGNSRNAGSRHPSKDALAANCPNRRGERRRGREEGGECPTTAPKACFG